MSSSGLAYLTFCLLFIANAYPSLAQNADADAGAGEAAEGTLLVSEQPLPVVYYSVHRNLTLRCSLPVDKGVRPVWKKNGTEVEKLSDLTGRYELREDGLVLNLTRPSTEDDFGNYSCGAGAGGQAWDVRARSYAKLDANTNVVEGQKLKLRCRVVGKPYPRVSWLYSNSSGGDEAAVAAALNGTEVRAALGSRVELRASEAGVPDGELVLEPAALADAGRYACVVSDSAALNAVTTVRVKDKYAALWPFLGICAEVFVLCAIILVYEKRRTKPELDDSDTDNHDQKKS